MVAVYGNVSAGTFIIRLAQGKQGADLAFLAGKGVGQIVIHVVRPHHGIVDLGAGDFEPGYKVAVLCLAGIQVNASLADTGRFAPMEKAAQRIRGALQAAQ